MISFYINDSDRTEDVSQGSFVRYNNIQDRKDTCDFVLFSGSKPTENQDVKIYLEDEIESVASNVITVKGYHRSGVNFYSGQVLWIGIGDADIEKVTVDSYDAETKEITLVSAPSGSFSGGDKIGELIFGGVVSRINTRNVQILSNLEYDIECVDYSKIFDKKLISDTWESVDSRYVINSFVNSTVNYNATLDNLSYDDNSAIQAAITEGGDGDNPTVNSDALEGDNSANLGWTNSSGTATFTITPTASDISVHTGAASGTPTEGSLMLWIKGVDTSVITSLKVRIGSGASDYAEYDLTPDDNDWKYYSAKLKDGSITGTPDWTDVDYIQIRIVQTGDSNVLLNGLRINHEGSFTLFNVEPTNDFDDLRSPQEFPSTLMQLMSQTWRYVWYVDYERDLHFKDREDDSSPFQLDNSSDNFTDLEIKVDQSQLGNRVIVLGGEDVSASTYAQVFPGDNAIREWILKGKYKNLAITIDNNSSTFTTEAGTDTTTINATGHGLSVGDHIVNRTVGVVREVLTVPDPNSFTVQAVTGQTDGDTISKFSVSKTVGIEGVDDESSYDYVGNSNERSIRATASEATLTSSEYIRFSYNERVPIQIQYSDPASINALKALGIADGIFDLDPIVDRNVQDQGTAIALAQARVNTYSNPLIFGSFITEYHGLKSGQILHIEETNRSLSEDYVIQKVTMRQQNAGDGDYMIYEVEFGTTLFGVIEFYQKLLSASRGIEINTDAAVATYVTSDEEVECADVNDLEPDEFASSNETVNATESNTVTTYSGAWQWETSSGQPLKTRWSLFQWS